MGNPHSRPPSRYSCFDPESVQFRVAHLLARFLRFFPSSTFSPTHPLLMSVLTVPFMQSSWWSCITSRVPPSLCFPRGPGALGADGKCGCKLSCLLLLSVTSRVPPRLSEPASLLKCGIWTHCAGIQRPEEAGQLEC